MNKKNVIFKFIIISSILTVFVALFSGCGKTEKKETKEEETTDGELSEDDPGYYISPDIRESDILSGVMQFGDFRFELGDKIFKFEDAGFECRENEYDTEVEPKTTKTIILYAAIGKDEENPDSMEYIYLKGYNPTDGEIALRNCDICFAQDDKANIYMHLGIAKGIIKDVARNDVKRLWGEPTGTSVQNNNDVWEYSNEEKTCTIFINKSTDLVEEISYQEKVDEQASRDDFTKELN